MSRLSVSFSGGETSAFMAWAIQNAESVRARYDEIVFLFANTGQENEQTLVFAKQCDEAFGLNLVWVEAEVYHGERKRGFRRVNFETAARGGQPFEEVIRKYGIPNQTFKYCTDRLKLEPMTAYLRSIGWAAGTYDTAVGIRIDEIDRMSSRAAVNRLVYPLVQWWPTTKPSINGWWEKQPFRLQLKGYQGNCKWCWKKSFRKHLTLLKESPEIYDFPRRMEATYGRSGPELRKAAKDGQHHANDPNYRRVFFRGNRSVEDLEQMLRDNPNFIPADDDSQARELFDATLDVGAGCEESCEVFADEDQAA